MSANDDQRKTEVKLRLKSWGFSVKELKRRLNSSTADLLVSRDHQYLIELKERGEDDAGGGNGSN